MNTVYYQIFLRRRLYTETNILKSKSHGHCKSDNFNNFKMTFCTKKVWSKLKNFSDRTNSKSLV